jgi:hypothetical protein
MPPRKGMMPMAIKAAVVRGGAGFGDAHNADKDLLHMAKADNEKAKRELDRRHGADAAMEHKKLVAPAGPRQLDELEKKASEARAGAGRWSPGGKRS